LPLPSPVADLRLSSSKKLKNIDQKAAYSRRSRDRGQSAFPERQTKSGREALKELKNKNKTPK